MGWMRDENEDEAAKFGRETLKQNALFQLLNSFSASGAPDAIEQEVDRIGREGLLPEKRSPEEIGRAIQSSPGVRAGTSVLDAILKGKETVENFELPKEGLIPKAQLRGGIVPPELGTHGSGFGLADFFMGRDEPELPEGWHAPMAMPKDEPLFQAHAKAKPPAPKPAQFPGMPAGWHPPMPVPPPPARAQSQAIRGPAPAPKKPMPNTPRDPDKERRMAEAMQALVKGQTGKAPNQSPAASVHPTQDPFGLTRPGPQGPQGIPGARGPQGPMSPASGPVPDVQASVDEFGDISANKMADLAPESDLRSQMLLKASGQGQGADDGAQDRRLLDFERDASRQSGNLEFMKLLLRSANKAGTLGGKAASSESFDDLVSGLQSQNQRNADYMTKLETGKKPGQSDTDKILLALLKMGQDAKLRREGRQVQREGNDSRTKLAEASLEATTGFRTGTLGLRKTEIQAQAEDRDEDRKLRREALDETKRKNKEDEDIKRKKAEAAKKKAKGITDTARKTKMFADRMKQAMDGYEKHIRSTGYDPTNVQDRLLSHTGKLGSSFKSDNGKLANQYEVEFVRAKLRDESGAAIGVEEASKEADAYFPRYGDTPQVLLQKKKAREVAVQSMMGEYQKELSPAEELEAEHGFSAEDGKTELQPGMKWQRNKRTGEMRQVPAN